MCELVWFGNPVRSKIVCLIGVYDFLIFSFCLVGRSDRGSRNSFAPFAPHPLPSPRKFGLSLIKWRVPLSEFAGTRKLILVGSLA
jgi:hypothetical protein